jgi:hypothetical protein
LEELRGTIPFPFNCTQVVVTHKTKRKNERKKETENKIHPKETLFFSWGVSCLKWKECEKLHFTDIGSLQFLGFRKTVVSDIEGKWRRAPTLVTTDHALLDAAV